MVTSEMWWVKRFLKKSESPEISTEIVPIRRLNALIFQSPNSRSAANEKILHFKVVPVR